MLAGGASRTLVMEIEGGVRIEGDVGEFKGGWEEERYLCCRVRLNNHNLAE